MARRDENDGEKFPMIDPRLDLLYYLQNFQSAIHWLAEIYCDLLSPDERAFIETFAALPVSAQALLVRLIMRKHDIFRGTKVCYPEIGDIEVAATPLVEVGFVDDGPLLSLSDLFELLRRDEINELFRLNAAARRMTKPTLLAALQPQHLHPRELESWRGVDDECAYRVLVAELCVRLRLLFFGSFHQEWSEFVLADLEIFKYERVDLGRQSRGFQSRADIESFYRIHRCRSELQDRARLDQAFASVPTEPIENAWLEDRRSKLLFEIAHRYERQGDVSRALAIYRQSSYPGARLRAIRVLERAGLHGEAIDAALQAASAPESAAELQGLERIIARLYRSAGIDVEPRPRVRPAQLDLHLDPLETRVEECVRLHLASTAAPVFYVENALITSLFGLLFWDAIFAPIPGAFFHRFHSAPMDLYDPDFVRRRQSIIDACFAQLDTADYVACIRQRFSEKTGTSSPFVAWGLLEEPLLDLALRCIPASHLRLFFQRILDDIRENCTGLPDLIQFWPQEGCYRLIEVKGPGDRLQDHQQRWAQFCAAHDMPICIANVRWAEARA
ncbi:MAG: VRR-NUC domain-containing protein [Steroidobacteraceae bacterium]